MSQKPCAKAAREPPAKKKLPRSNTPTQSRGRATQAARDTFQVVIHCASEAEQEQLYDEFRSRNFSVRLLTM
ncbi:MAG: hypothetical protein IAF94_03590 [Pirellulaceae bacterium]|nr:hypothetical protein [Pirellulaceae bacterium]